MPQLRPLLLLSSLLYVAAGAWAQATTGAKTHAQLAGEDMEVIVGEDGDTLYLAKSLIDVSVSSPRSFANLDEYRLYLKYRYYAPKVYPYAVQAIRIFRETEYITENMGERARKKHIRRLQKELKKEFEDPLKGLTKTQGYILVKMIERETGSPMHELIKDLRGAVTATYWSTMGKMFGHELRDGYHVGDDHILDIVLQDYNVAHVVLNGVVLEAKAEEKTGGFFGWFGG